jgi:hypothetical protein
MKRILLAAGIGLTVLTVTMSTMPSHHYMTIKDYGNINDTVPKKRDTTKPKPRPDTPSIEMTASLPK